MSETIELQDELPPIVKKITRIADIVEKVVLVVAVIMGGLMTFVVIFGVFARYIVQNPAVWTEELARALMIWTAYLGISVVLRRRGHLGIHYVVTKLPISLQRIVKLFNDTLICIFLVVLIMKGLDMVAAAKTQFEPATGITMNYPFSIVPLCGVLTITQLFLQVLVDFSLWGTKISPFDQRLAQI